MDIHLKIGDMTIDSSPSCTPWYTHSHLLHTVIEKLLNTMPYAMLSYTPNEHCTSPIQLIRSLKGRNDLKFVHGLTASQLLSQLVSEDYINFSTAFCQL